MFLAEHHKGIFKVLKSIRRRGKVKTINIKYVGRLTFEEKEKLKLLLSTVKTSKELNLAIDKAKSPAIKILKDTIQPIGISDDPRTKVKLVEVRDGVFKKEIEKEWLRKIYVEDRRTLGHIAQLLGISKERVREHLDELGIEAEARIKFAKERHEDHHLEFGWHIIDGQRVKDPTEYKIILKMKEWRSEGLSFQKIADRLDKMGVTGKLGSTKWDRSTVRKLLLRNS